LQATPSSQARAVPEQEPARQRSSIVQKRSSSQVRPSLLDQPRESCSGSQRRHGLPGSGAPLATHSLSMKHPGQVASQMDASPSQIGRGEHAPASVLEHGPSVRVVPFRSCSLEITISGSGSISWLSADRLGEGSAEFEVPCLAPGWFEAVVFVTPSATGRTFASQAITTQAVRSAAGGSGHLKRECTPCLQPVISSYSRLWHLGRSADRIAP
jgi:hypothetical protein